MRGSLRWGLWQLGLVGDGDCGGLWWGVGGSEISMIVDGGVDVVVDRTNMY